MSERIFYNDLNSKVDQYELDERLSTLKTFHLGNEEPESEDMLWVDLEEDDVATMLPQNSPVLDEFRQTLNKLDKKVNEISYALNYKMDSGYFNGVMPGAETSNYVIDAGYLTDPNVYDENRDKKEREGEDIDGSIPEGEEPTETPDIELEAKGTVKTICIKRGYKRDLEGLFEGELAYCLDSNDLFIGGNNGQLKLLASAGGAVNGGGGSGGGNVSSTYIDLLAPNNTAYRTFVNNAGSIKTVKSSIDIAPDASENDVSKFTKLKIQHVFGGGESRVNASPVSHGFIELYNNGDVDLNLKGLSLQLGTYQGNWEVLPLRGIIPAHSSFLVRCNEVSDINLLSTRARIINYDMDWDIFIPTIGYKVCLIIGRDPITVPNPANFNGAGGKINGFIDLFGVAGESLSTPIDGYEGNYYHKANIFTSFYRKDFGDTDQNHIDFIPNDFRTCDLSIHMPKCSSDGKWDIYYDKIKLNDRCPSLITMAFGKDGETSRTFTWQTVRTDKGYIKYKKKGDSKFKTIPSEKMIVVHGDVDAIKHSVIVRNLTPGTYIYKVGEEGMWSDEYEFEVKKLLNTDPLEILQVSDQQGWNLEEYTAWQKANEYIEQNEDYDMIINTGDISQNANRSFEWRYYYHFATENMATHPQLTCCGNNDLINKEDPTAFTYYSTYELDEDEAFLPSVYSCNYGYVHFIGLNSNIGFGFTPIEKQIEWLRKDMAKPENQKRWTIVIMHESPYQIRRTTKYEAFAEAFEELGVDLVLCGHHHRYSRTAQITGCNTSTGEVYVKSPDSTEHGVCYVMCGATGFKTVGKAKPDPDNENTRRWRKHMEGIGDPMYIKYHITYDSITMNPYRLAKILPLEDNHNNTPERIAMEDTRNPQIYQNGSITLATKR